MPAFPSALPAPVHWRRPSRLNPKVVDAVEVARDGRWMRIRSSLGREVWTTPEAFADLVWAARCGEYDDLLPGVR
ncbi:DUF397 domain-containing protein [Parafrankia sp. FMc6]|uniref:DUF397 domain-containing protein n=1 Tax=Parafrankia soli TaxID=2599596 RepID=UPI0034D49856